VPADHSQRLPLLRRGQLSPHPEEEEDERKATQEDRHEVTIPAREAPKAFGKLRPFTGVMEELEDKILDMENSESLFADAIRDHLDLKARNSGLDSAMPLEPYLGEDTFENHPLFKSEEQARIEETLEGEPAADPGSEQLPWPGEETAESVEGAALDETLWTGRPRDFDWGD
jgi:hypothetical protein